LTNTEYSLHPILRKQQLVFSHKLPVSTSRIFANIDEGRFLLLHLTRRGTVLLTSGGILRNSCVIANGTSTHLVATLDSIQNDRVEMEIVEQYRAPYAIFECKREGQRAASA